MHLNDISSMLNTSELACLENALKALEKEQANKSESKQIRKIVPIEEWINSSYYAGPDIHKVYPYWKERIIEIFNSKIPVNEIILSGAIGVGKSTVALYILARRIYELSCFTNIPARFNLMSSSLVSFLYFSLSKTQAELTGFGQIKNLIDSIPYFQEHFPRNSGVNSLIVWPKENLLITYGSEPSHAIGMNMMGSILDEANFFMNDPQNPNKTSNGVNGKMSRMYSSIINRAKSRFIVNGVDYSLSILISSATTSTSFTEERISQAMGKENTRIYAPTLWDVKPKGTYSDTHFWVFCGDEGVDPFLVYSIADVNVFLETKGLPKCSHSSIDKAISELPIQYSSLFIKVPDNFRQSFEINIIQSLQDIAGRSVAPTGKLFNSRTAYKACIHEGLRHPFTKDQIVISTGDSIQIQDYLIPGFEFFDKNKPHTIHIDQSVTTDYTGISMSHIDRYEEDESGIKKAIVRVDFMLDIIPPSPPRQISISKVRDFCFYLRDKMGVNIALVTYDMYACLTGDTLVLTSAGWRPLSELKVGDYVKNDSGLHQIKEVHKYWTPNLVEIATKNCVIKGTPNHKIRVLSGWTESLSHELSDYYQSRLKSKRKPVWVEKPLSEIQEGDILDIRFTRANENKNVDYNTRLKWYLIGYALGDASWSRDGFCFSFGSLNEAVHIRDLLASLDGRVRRLTKDSRTSDCWSLHYCDRPFMRVLEALGFSFKGAQYKGLPECVFSLPLDAQLELLNGLIDSDGCVSGNTVRITTVSKEMAEGIVKLATLYLGIDAVYNKEIGGDKVYPNGKVYYQNDQYVITLNGDKILLKSSLFKVKSERLNTSNSRYVFQKVVKKSIINQESTVYDISVEGDNHYIANGVYSHNSAESRQVLNDGGIKSDYLSVDRTDEQYLALVNLILEHRIEYYDYSVFRRELFDLIWYRARRKVDHPGDTASGGTKDLCDSLVGSVWNTLHLDSSSVNSDSDVQLLLDINNEEEDEMDIFFKGIVSDILK